MNNPILKNKGWKQGCLAPCTTCPGTNQYFSFRTCCQGLETITAVCVNNSFPLSPCRQQELPIKVSLGLQTDDPTLLYVGAIASLLPDIDTPISTAGCAFPGISHWLQRRFRHRSFTHSFVASFVLAIATYPTAVLENVVLGLIHAINIEYFAGWFADIFTCSGVEMFYPSPVRWALPSNRNLRLRTGSQAEYRLLVVLVAIALFSFHISANGGILIQFNRLIGSISGVEQLYDKLGATHLIAAQNKGFRALDYTPVMGDFWII